MDLEEITLLGLQEVQDQGRTLFFGCQSPVLINVPDHASRNRSLQVKLIFDCSWPKHTLPYPEEINGSPAQFKEGTFCYWVTLQHGVNWFIYTLTAISWQLFSKQGLRDIFQSIFLKACVSKPPRRMPPGMVEVMSDDAKGRKLWLHCTCLSMCFKKF